MKVADARSDGDEHASERALTKHSRAAMKDNHAPSMATPSSSSVAIEQAAAVLARMLELRHEGHKGAEVLLRVGVLAHLPILIMRVRAAKYPSSFFFCNKI